MLRVAGVVDRHFFTLRTYLCFFVFCFPKRGIQVFFYGPSLQKFSWQPLRPYPTSRQPFPQVQETLEEKAVSLGNPWDAERVRKALWSQAMHSRFGLVVTPCPGAGTSCPRGEGSSASGEDVDGGERKRGESRKRCDAAGGGGKKKSDEKRHRSRR